MTKGDRIKNRRIVLNMTQLELAQRLNTSKQTISKYEKNIITNIPSDRLEDIANALQTTPAFLMGWDTEEIDKIPKNDHSKIEQEFLELISDFTDDEIADLYRYATYIKKSR